MIIRDYKSEGPWLSENIHRLIYATERDRNISLYYLTPGIDVTDIAQIHKISMARVSVICTKMYLHAYNLATLGDVANGDALLKNTPLTTPTANELSKQGIRTVADLAGAALCGYFTKLPRLKRAKDRQDVKHFCLNLDLTRMSAIPRYAGLVPAEVLTSYRQFTEEEMGQ